MKMFGLTISEIWNYNKDNERNLFFKEAYVEGSIMTLDELRTRILYLGGSPPDCQPFLNRWLAGQRGYEKARKERFPDKWKFANVVRPNAT